MDTFIRLENVSKYYSLAGRDFMAINGISLEIGKGEIFGIMGQSGAGKSTLLRCLSSLEKPTNGNIWVGGENITLLKKRPLRAFRKRTGMIFQHFNLLSSRTVGGNVAFPLELDHRPPSEIDGRVNSLLQIVGLLDKKNAYPSQLSGGEKQRVGIARALAHNPDVLFCDEATSALDPKTTKEILQLIRDVNKKLGVTIVLITHQMEVIKQICHKVAVIEKGVVVESGSVSDVFSDPKHPTTKNFLQNSIHELPLEFFKKTEGRHLVRLYFKGGAAKQPIITDLIRHHDVSVNILLGWIDALQETTIGTLTVELIGSTENRNRALRYLEQQQIRYEVLDK